MNNGVEGVKEIGHSLIWHYLLGSAEKN